MGSHSVTCYLILTPLPPGISSVLIYRPRKRGHFNIMISYSLFHCSCVMRTPDERWRWSRSSIPSNVTLPLSGPSDTREWDCGTNRSRNGSADIPDLTQSSRRASSWRHGWPGISLGCARLGVM